MNFHISIKVNKNLVNKMTYYYQFKLDEKKAKKMFSRT